MAKHPFAHTFTVWKLGLNVSRVPWPDNYPFMIITVCSICVCVGRWNNGTYITRHSSNQLKSVIYLANISSRTHAASSRYHNEIIYIYINIRLESMKYRHIPPPPPPPNHLHIHTHLGPKGRSGVVVISIYQSLRLSVLPPISVSLSVR